jgi:hypothetical protein
MEIATDLHKIKMSYAISLLRIVVVIFLFFSAKQKSRIKEQELEYFDKKIEKKKI